VGARGESWSLNEALWHMPERRQRSGVAGSEQPGINSVLINPRNPSDIRIGVSCQGLWASTDTGATWQIINDGMYNEYMPPERREDPIVQDIHLLSRCAARPEIVWCQHHNGVFLSEDAGANWQDAFPKPPRTAARKAEVLDARKQLGERDRLSAGGNRIRTIGSAGAGPDASCVGSLSLPLFGRR